jgi:hypothetical protein
MRSCSEPNVQSRSLGSSIYYNSQRRKDYRVFLPTLLYSESVGPTEIAKQLRRAISASVDRVARRAVEPSGNRPKCLRISAGSLLDFTLAQLASSSSFSRAREAERTCTTPPFSLHAN